MGSGSKRKKRPLVIRILRILLFAFLGFLVLVLILTGYLYLDRDNISKHLLLSSNKYTRGELSFESIAFNPFRQFPSMSMLIKDIEYYENPVCARHQNEKPIIRLERLSAALDVREFIGGKIHISSIILENGDFCMVRYPDSSLNIINAVTRLENDVPETGDTMSSEEVFEIDLESVLFDDVGLEFENRVDRNLSDIDIHDLRASFYYSPDTIYSELLTDIRVNAIELSDIIRLRNTGLELETAFVFDRNDLSLDLDPSTLIIDRARLDLEGVLSFMDKGSVDLKIDGSDHDFTFFQMFISETGMENLEEGDMYFRGTIKNNTLRGIPIADLSFGFQDVKIYSPKADDYISDLNLKGALNTSSKADLSQAWVRVDTLYAILPNGNVNASFSLLNFRAPEFDLHWDIKGNLSGVDQIFKIEFLDSMIGNISSRCVVSGGYYNPDADDLSAEFFELDLEFDSTSLSIPGIMNIRFLDGRIHHRRDSTFLHDLKAITDDSDFLINGNISNAIYLPFQVDTVITADLQIQSGIFDLPEFLDFVPEVRESFPFRITDINLDVSVITGTRRFLDMEPNPSMTFRIKHLDACVEDLLPPATISNGLFDLHHENKRVTLDFKDFDIAMPGSSLNADLEFRTPASRRSRMNMKIEVDSLNPARLIWDEKSDTIPEFLDGLLSGSFLLDLHFPHDSLQTLKKIELRQADLLFINSRDTIETLSFNLLAQDIYIDAHKDPNPFASLTSSISLSSEKTRFNSFTWEGFEYNIGAEEGKYTIHPNKTKIFGKEGTGLFVLDPFSEVPGYKIRYLVEQYEVQDFMSNFRDDTLMSGKMDFLVDVSFEDVGDQNLLSTLNGQIILKGKDLTLYGIELDKLIRKFERSQNFNLVDLGAVMFAGPAGLALTKGGAYADILVASYGETSQVTEMISDWEISKGKINLRDLAFSTKENRVAAKGWVNLATDSLDITIALVNKKGCSIIEQSLYGLSKEPDRSKAKVLATILAPVTNLLEAVLGTDCEVFYEGSIPHPVKKNK